MKGPAISNPIKTYSTLYLGEETDGAVASGTEFNPLRLSSDGLASETETLESDVILPESRVKAAKETGTKSCSGDLNSEWNVDEQDALLAAVMCSEWQDVEKADGETSHKRLVLGDIKRSFSALRKYPQAPTEYQMFKGLRVDTLKIDMAIKSFVKLTWSLKGTGFTKKLTGLPSPVTEADLKDALTTKAFKTLEGSIYTGLPDGELEQNRQISSLSISIANNMESTDALFETEAIEQSLGDFVVSGSFDFWNSGKKARDIYNLGTDGTDYVIKTSVSRSAGGIKTTYKILLKVHLDKVSESKDGNKFKNTAEFTMTDVEGIAFEKIVEAEISEPEAPDEPPEQETVSAAVPTIDTDLQPSVNVDENTQLSLAISASASDGGSLSYQWQKDGSDIDGATESSYSVASASYSDEGTYRCVVTNTLGETTATATSNACEVSVLQE